jgi:hypothetical protein
VKLLKSQGIDVSDKTIRRWASEDSWPSRMREADIVSMASTVPLSASLIREGIAERLASWKAYYATNPGDVDPIATGAYVQLCKFALKVLPADEGTGTVEDMRRAREVLEDEYGVE